MINKVVVKVVNKSNNELPAYGTELAAGVDVRANIEDTITVHPLERVLVPTGLFVEIPAGYEIQVRPRSGMAINHGITVLNSPGTIDADYRGEIKVILVNLSNNAHTIQHGDRVAQMVLNKVENIEWEAVTELSATVRQDGGFGHTGKK
ncbi:dUTP diphosphatase [Gynurincola endophyticus]|jgi:dUTP pyrophosphatase|uniref:dUTP diphosphatase n=1 Tax=Gynurincola endophyticus TaxID=2479004 RepID=UPI000F8DD012|nr:dUTP diphosphatase [Gynurincola endophyticus]